MSTKKCYIFSVNFLFYKRKKPQILKENQFLTILKIYGFILKESLKKNQQSDFLKALKIYAVYHVTSILSQIFFSSPSVEKYFAFSIFGTTLIVSPRRNSAFAVVFAIID